MEFNELTEEQKAKVRGANTPEEMLAIAREEGYELSDDELDAVSGGLWSCSSWTPEQCGIPHTCGYYKG